MKQQILTKDRSLLVVRIATPVVECLVQQSCHLVFMFLAILQTLKWGGDGDGVVTEGAELAE
jgi:hypothetical protein